MPAFSVKEQLALLEVRGDEAIENIIERIRKGTSLSRDEAFAKRSELFFFTRSQFEAWCENADIQHFADTVPGSHDGLYLLHENEGEWIVFWQERESRYDRTSFSSWIEAKRAAIEMAIAYLTGWYRF
jgi:hypothetical protein